MPEAPAAPTGSEREHRALEREINAVLPILAHGLLRRLENRGLAGRVQIRAVAGDRWMVGASADNTERDIPNVLVYPRNLLAEDRPILNARLRHEVGNLNYPIQKELGELREWCLQRSIPPILLTVLVEAIHEASVNYLEMRNAYSARPEEDFQALYRSELSTEKIARDIREGDPYKQLIDVVLLHALASCNLCPEAHVELALAHADPRVRQLFSPELRQLVVQAVRTANPAKKLALIRDQVWPQVASLAAASTLRDRAEAAVQDRVDQGRDAAERAIGAAPRPRKTEQGAKATTNAPQSPPKKEVSPAEQRELEETRDSLLKRMREQLDRVREQWEKRQGKEPGPQEDGRREPSPTLKDLREQAQELHKQVSQERADAAPSEEQAGERDDLERIKDELAEIEKVARELEEQESEAAADEEPIDYNIQEFGIDESLLSAEQLAHLQRIRAFAQHTSRAYRTAMRMLMRGYQRQNPKFTDDIMQKMMDRRYDMPAFSIYGPPVGQEFLDRQEGLGATLSDGTHFLVNFNLPRPLARFWYRGGSGSKSQPVKDGQIEWGLLYRLCQPVIWSSVDRAALLGLYLHRLNDLGQHDPRQYYYLWEAVPLEPSKPGADPAEGDAGEEAEGDGSQGDAEPGQEGERGEASDDPQGEARGDQSDSGADGGDASGGSPDTSGEDGDGGGVASDGPQGESGGGRTGDDAGGADASGGSQDASGELGRGGAGAAGEHDDGGGGDGPGANGSGEPKPGPAGEGAAHTQGQRGDNGQPMPSRGGQAGSQGGEGGENGGTEPQERQGGEEEHQQAGGASRAGSLEGVSFSASLREQLEALERELQSKFEEADGDGDERIQQELERMDQEESQALQEQQLATIEQIKDEHRERLEGIYKEMSGLGGEALRKYTEYMEAMGQFIDDLTEFFVKKFRLDEDYLRTRNHPRGSRLQRGYQRKIVGMKDGGPLLDPRILERKVQPKRPSICWTIVIDNTGSCAGDLIEAQKKLAVALIEVSKRLEIPLEIVIFTEGGYTFLKTFEDEAVGDNLEKVVLLQATVGNQQDALLLNAACRSMQRFGERYQRPHHFLYFITDGMVCGDGRIEEIIQKFKREVVITGIGLHQAAASIGQRFGKNALPVPDEKRLSDLFLRKIEDQIDATFD